MKTITTILAGVATGLTALTAAQASTVVDLDKKYSNLFGPDKLRRTVTLTIDGDSSRLNAGLFHLTDGVRDVLAFCIEPESRLKLNEDFQTGVQSSPWASSFGDIDKLFTSSYAQVTDKDTAAGFQLALWEIISETTGNYDLTTGSLQVSGAAGAMAKGALFLAALQGAGTGGYSYNTYVNSGQDLIEVVSTPLPAAALLFAPALGAFAARRRRQKA